MVQMALLTIYTINEKNEGLFLLNKAAERQSRYGEQRFSMAFPINLYKWKSEHRYVLFNLANGLATFGRWDIREEADLFVSAG